MVTCRQCNRWVRREHVGDGTPVPSVTSVSPTPWPTRSWSGSGVERRTRNVGRCGANG